MATTPNALLASGRMSRWQGQITLTAVGKLIVCDQRAARRGEQTVCKRLDRHRFVVQLCCFAMQETEKRTGRKLNLEG